MSGVGQGTGRLAKRGIVSALSRLCGWLDWLPGWDRDDEGWHWYRYGCWGCRWQLAARSCDLDERWGTGVWKAMP